jgi:hypothetical protein
MNPGEFIDQHNGMIYEVTSINVRCCKNQKFESTTSRMDLSDPDIIVAAEAVIDKVNNLNNPWVYFNGGTYTMYEYRIRSNGSYGEYRVGCGEWELLADGPVMSAFQAAINSLR